MLSDPWLHEREQEMSMLIQAILISAAQLVAEQSTKSHGPGEELASSRRCSAHANYSVTSHIPTKI